MLNENHTDSKKPLGTSTSAHSPTNLQWQVVDIEVAQDVNFFPILIRQYSPAREEFMSLLPLKVILRPFQLGIVQYFKSESAFGIVVSTEEISHLLPKELREQYISAINSYISNISNEDSFLYKLECFNKIIETKPWIERLTYLYNFEQGLKKMDVALEKKFSSLVFAADDLELKSNEEKAIHIYNKLEKETQNYIRYNCCGNLLQLFLPRNSYNYSSVAQEKESEQLLEKIFAIFFIKFKQVYDIYFPLSEFKTSKFSQMRISDIEKLKRIKKVNHITLNADKYIGISDRAAHAMALQMHTEQLDLCKILDDAKGNIVKKLVEHKNKGSMLNLLFDIPRSLGFYYFSLNPSFILLSTFSYAGFFGDKMQYIFTPPLMLKVKQLIFKKSFSNSSIDVEEIKKELLTKNNYNLGILSAADVRRIHVASEFLAIDSNHNNLWNRKNSKRILKKLERFINLFSIASLQGLIKEKSLQVRIKKGCQFSNKSELNKYIFNKVKEELLRKAHSEIEEFKDLLHKKLNRLSRTSYDYEKKLHRITGTGSYSSYFKTLAAGSDAVDDAFSKLNKVICDFTYDEPINKEQIEADMKLELSKKDDVISKHIKSNAQKDIAISQKDAEISKHLESNAQKDAEISKLKEQIAKLSLFHVNSDNNQDNIASYSLGT